MAFSYLFPGQRYQQSIRGLPSNVKLCASNPQAASICSSAMAVAGALLLGASRRAGGRGAATGNSEAAAGATTATGNDQGNHNEAVKSASVLATIAALTRSAQERELEESKQQVLSEDEGNHEGGPWHIEDEYESWEDADQDVEYDELLKNLY